MLGPAVVAAGVGNVEKSSALFTIILKRVPKHLLPEKIMMQNVASKSQNIKKKIIVQVGIIVIAILGN
jgi:hypothetical protein